MAKVTAKAAAKLIEVVKIYSVLNYTLHMFSINNIISNIVIRVDVLLIACCMLLRWLLS